MHPLERYHSGQKLCVFRAKRGDLGCGGSVVGVETRSLFCFHLAQFMSQLVMLGADVPGLILHFESVVLQKVNRFQANGCQKRMKCQDEKAHSYDEQTRETLEQVDVSTYIAALFRRNI